MSGTTIAANTGFFSGNIDLVVAATDLQSAVSSATSDLASVLAAETDTAQAAATMTALAATLTATTNAAVLQAAASASTAAASATAASVTAGAIAASATATATAAATAAVLAGGALPLTGGTLTGGLTGTTGTFSGVVTGPTAAVDTSSTAYATTAYVVGQAASALPLINNAAATGTSTRFARGDHVHPVDTSRYAATNPSGFQTAAQVTAVVPVASSTTPLGAGTAAVGVGTTWARADHVHPTDATRAPLASPTFTGTVTIPAGASISGFAPLASPTFTGTVTIPAGASISGFAPVASPGFTGTMTAAGITATGTLNSQGALNVGTGTTQQTLTMNGPAGSSRIMAWSTAGSRRWQLSASSAAESGANAGSDLVIQAFDDGGVSLTSPLTLTRSSSTVTFGALAKFAPFTVATLPAAATAGAGTVAYVTDATAPTYRGALVGGGAVKCLVFCDGTSWTSQ